MNPILKLAILVIAAGMVVGTTSMVTSVTASTVIEDDPAREGLDKADQNVHERAIQNDRQFHEGLCQGGHSTTAVDRLFGGCEEALRDGDLTEPGNSDDNRQDD